MEKKGFTLIEVLIVVSIIAILAAILIVAIIGTIEPAKVRTTDRRIKIIEDGLNRFVQKFSQRENVAAGASGIGYPRREEFAGLRIEFEEESANVVDMTGGEFLRLMLFPTDKEIEEYLKDYGIISAILTNEEVSEILNEEVHEDGDSGRTITAYTAFVDAWGFPFYYKFPGMNHSDKNIDSEKHQNWKEDYGFNHMAKMNPKPDIWSSGSNNVSEDPTRENEWESELNDPFNESGETKNDDITNWFINER
ncbi:MAG: prepilin-type N-terminal cleavage/methylation domain-containing protein [Planctomycetes bacterium]|nr:prepilin-type N-terminal cleavage/methylation domain-containing protein [Planctomycetota bacterium]